MSKPSYAERIGMPCDKFYSFIAFDAIEGDTASVEDQFNLAVARIVAEERAGLREALEAILDKYTGLLMSAHEAGSPSPSVLSLANEISSAMTVLDALEPKS